MSIMKKMLLSLRSITIAGLVAALAAFIAFGILDVTTPGGIVEVADARARGTTVV